MTAPPRPTLVPLSPSPSPTGQPLAPGLESGVQQDTTVLPGTVTQVAHAQASLFSWWVPTGFGFALLLLVGAVGVRWRLRRRRGAPPPGHRLLRRTATGVTAFVLLVLTVASAVNTYAGYLPTVAAAGRFLTQDKSAGVSNDGTTRDALASTADGQAAIAHGDTRWHIASGRYLDDPALGIRHRQVIVATPPGYATSGHTYPTLYVFPGYPGRASDWFESGRVTQVLDALVKAGLSPYFLVVAPDVNGGFFTDSETLDAVGGPKVETWVTTDVVAWTESHYRALPDRAHRVLAGMSSGGYAALNLALHHQDEFGITLAMEPYGDPGNVTARLFGGDVALLHANSPSYYLPRTPLHRHLDVFLDVGAGVADVQRVTDLANLLHRRGQPGVLLRAEPGQGHTWSEVQAGLPYALTFAARSLADPTLAQTYPESDFPTTRRGKSSLLLSPDAETQRALVRRCTALRREQQLGVPLVLPTGCPVPRAPGASGGPAPEAAVAPGG